MMKAEQLETSPTLPALSSQFFDKVPELAIIEEPFRLAEIEKQLAIRDVDNQFELLRAITETKKHKLRLRSNTVMENKKNRYPEQSIFEHSRVHIGPSPPGDQARKRARNDYINANYILWEEGQGSEVTILSQAPLQDTLGDFISAIVDNRITCVVMLCNVTENGKNRCYDYLNEKDLYEAMELVPIQSILPGKLKSETDIELRRVKVRVDRQGDAGQQKEEGFHEFYHLLFTEWPDKSVPDEVASIQPVLEFCTRHSRVMIHCSAGLGRSGVVAALYKIIRDLGSRGSQGKVSVFKTVRGLREDRFGAVQNSQQYKFIYEYMKFHWGQEVQ